MHPFDVLIEFRQELVNGDPNLPFAYLRESVRQSVGRLEEEGSGEDPMELAFARLDEAQAAIEILIRGEVVTDGLRDRLS